MTFHIWNGDNVVNNIIFELNVVKGIYHDKELDERLDKAKDNIIQNINIQARNIEIRGVLKQRINTFRADELECPDIRRWWSQMEYLSIARSLPAIEEFLKEIYGKNYQAYVNKMMTYKSLLNDIKYRMDIEINGKYSVTNPDHRKFIHETELKISRLGLINQEAKRTGMFLDTFTSMGDMTVPSTTLQQARAKFRKVEYEQTDKREMQRAEFIGGE